MELNQQIKIWETKDKKFYLYTCLLFTLLLLAQIQGLKISNSTMIQSHLTDTDENYFFQGPIIPDGEFKRRNQNEKHKKELNSLLISTANNLEEKLNKILNANISINKKTSSILIDFPTGYFEKGSDAITETIQQALKEIVPPFIKVLAENETSRKALKEIKFFGFSSPMSEGLNDQGKIIYNKKLATARARSSFQYIYNVDKVEFQHQDFAVKYSKISGLGPVELAREIYGESDKSAIKKLCQHNDCHNLKMFMLKPIYQLETNL